MSETHRSAQIIYNPSFLSIYNILKKEKKNESSLEIHWKLLSIINSCRKVIKGSRQSQW